MKNVLVMLWSVFVLSAPSIASAQAVKPPTAQEVEEKVEQAKAVKAQVDDAQASARPMRALSNVQVELTLTDQKGTATPDKKTVSMIVSDGSWGKIRNSAVPSRVGLNVDARPFLRAEGQIQIELTLYYYPPRADTTSAGTPTELNQSLTVQLQSGKSLIISQAADPVSDRKVIVELKATILK